MLYASTSFVAWCVRKFWRGCPSFRMDWEANDKVNLKYHIYNISESPTQLVRINDTDLLVRPLICGVPLG